MKCIAVGIAAAGAAAAAAFAASATADSGWELSSYDVNDAQLVQSPARTQLAWEIPATFTKGDETLSGTVFTRPTASGPDDQFVVGDHGAIYAYGSQSGSGYGVPAMYYSPAEVGNPAGSAGQLMASSGAVHLNSGLSWLVEPADYAHPITSTAALDKVPFSDALSLRPGGSGEWTSHYGDMTGVTYQGVPVWSFQDASFSNGDTTLDGTVYLQSLPGRLGLYNEEFVDGKAVYDYNQGFLGFDNMYFNPGDGGSVVDILKTPLGEMNLSGLAWLFAPPDYSALTGADNITAADLTDALKDSSLPSVIDFGDTVAHAAAAVSALG